MASLSKQKDIMWVFNFLKYFRTNFLLHFQHFQYFM